MGKEVKCRRIYEDATSEDGVRILVDRIWPRGMRKEDAHIDEWMRDVAPSTELRRWYGHDPDRYAEFSRRYLTELREPERQQALQQLRETARRQEDDVADRRPRPRAQPGRGPRRLAEPCRNHTRLTCFPAGPGRGRTGLRNGGLMSPAPPDQLPDHPEAIINVNSFGARDRLRVGDATFDGVRCVVGPINALTRGRQLVRSRRPIRRRRRRLVAELGHRLRVRSGRGGDSA